MKLHIASDEQAKKPSAFENTQKIDELRQYWPSPAILPAILDTHDLRWADLIEPNKRFSWNVRFNRTNT